MIFVNIINWMEKQAVDLATTLYCCFCFCVFMGLPIGLRQRFVADKEREVAAVLTQNGCYTLSPAVYCLSHCSSSPAGALPEWNAKYVSSSLGRKHRAQEKMTLQTVSSGELVFYPGHACFCRISSCGQDSMLTHFRGTGVPKWGRKIGAQLFIQPESLAITWQWDKTELNLYLKKHLCHSCTVYI